MKTTKPKTSIAPLALLKIQSFFRGMALGLGLLVWSFIPQTAQAGILSAGICRPYKQLVDNDLFLVIAAICAVGLVIAWKAQGGAKVLGSGLSLVAALIVALNLENLLQVATGSGAFC